MFVVRRRPPLGGRRAFASERGHVEDVLLFRRRATRVGVDDVGVGVQNFGSLFDDELGERGALFHELGATRHGAEQFPPKDATCERGGCLFGHALQTLQGVEHRSLRLLRVILVLILLVGLVLIVVILILVVSASMRLGRRLNDGEHFQNCLRDGHFLFKRFVHVQRAVRHRARRVAVGRAECDDSVDDMFDLPREPVEFRLFALTLELLGALAAARLSLLLFEFFLLLAKALRLSATRVVRLSRRCRAVIRR